MNGYITVQEVAEKWGVTPRQVQILCKTNRIPGATRLSRIWIIPENAEKPTNEKRKVEFIMNNKIELQKLVEHFDVNIDFYKDTKKAYNEHSCRIEFIDPFLKILDGT